MAAVCQDVTVGDLDVTIWNPAGGSLKKAIFVFPAIGSSAHTYRDFGAFLAAQGFSVFLPRMDGERASRTVDVWAIGDFGMLLDDFAGRFGAHAKLAVAHSFGGVLLGLQSANAMFEKALLVSAPFANLGSFRLATRIKMALVLYSLIPFQRAIQKSKPVISGRLLGLGPIPLDQVRDVARCIRSKRYFGGVSELERHSANFLRFAGEILCVSVGDDPLASPEQNSRLVERFASASGVAHAAVVGTARPIGHLGFFRGRSSHHWREIVVPYLLG